MVGMNKNLSDIQVVDPSGLKNLIVHAKIVDSDLVLTVDFDTGRFAISSYLGLKGRKITDKDFKEKIDNIDDGRQDF